MLEPGRSARQFLLCALALGALSLAGWGFSAKAGNRPTSAPHRAAPVAQGAPSPASIDVTPGAGDVRPDVEVTVRATNGTLTDVTVLASDGASLVGEENLASTTWKAAGMLEPGAKYTVHATAANAAGKLTTVSQAFAAFRPAATKRLRASSIAPRTGTTVGIAQPVAIGFNHPVRDRAAVERALQLTSTPPVVGAWYWIDDEQVDFRPRDFWPAGARVTLNAKLTGVDAGNGLWGVADRTVQFRIGAAQIIRVDVRRHRMSVERDGTVLRTFPITSGKRGWETRNGIKVIMEKVRGKTWTSEAIHAPEHYRLHSDYAMRMTNSGEFIHDAPWSMGNIGRVSASHGCVGMYPSDARWLFAHTTVGDAVVVTGSPKRYTELWNRYADWNVPWATWRAGNA